MVETIKTGTTTLGIVCKDGIVLAADCRATAGHLVVQRDVEKVIPINDRMVVTIAGSVSDIMKTIKYIKAETRLNKLKIGRHNSAKEAANLIGNMVYYNIRSMGSVTHFVFAGMNDDGSFELYDIFPDGSTNKIKTFVASGSGSVFADGVLETSYKADMTIAQGVDLAKKALHASLLKDSASGNGANIYKLTKDGVEKVETIIVNTGLY
jgi:proteasome beta subunit